MDELDPRLLSVSIEVNGVTKVYNQEFAIRCTGMHFATPLMDECQITIFNLDRATQDYILTQTSPYTLDRSLKRITVSAGRASYGLTAIYSGNVVSSSASQPPDIGVTLNCLTGFVFQAQAYSVSQAGIASEREIANNLAENLKASMIYQSDANRQIANYNHNGTAQQEMVYLNSLGGTNIFLVGAQNALIIKDWYVPLRNTLRVVSPETGMIGIPEFNQFGIKVKFFIDSKTTIGGALRVVSHRYPAFNGDYAIYKLGFDLASRDTPFYYVAEAARINPKGLPIT